MGTTWSLIRVVSRQVRISALFLLAILIGWTSATQLLASTPSGVQCPTAAVQTISVPVKACCGKIVAYVTRAPRQGEKGFVQCRCAEKRSASQQAGLTQGAPHFEMMPPVQFAFPIPDRIKEATVETTHVARVMTVPSVPLVPPPSVA